MVNCIQCSCEILRVLKNLYEISRLLKNSSWKEYLLSPLSCFQMLSTHIFMFSNFERTQPCSYVFSVVCVFQIWKHIELIIMRFSVIFHNCSLLISIQFSFMQICFSCQTSHSVSGLVDFKNIIHLYFLISRNNEPNFIWTIIKIITISTVII